MTATAFERPVRLHIQGPPGRPGSKRTSKLFAFPLIVFCDDFPANTAHTWFQAQAADNLFE